MTVVEETLRRVTDRIRRVESRASWADHGAQGASSREAAESTVGSRRRATSTVFGTTTLLRWCLDELDIAVSQLTLTLTALQVWRQQRASTLVPISMSTLLRAARRIWCLEGKHGDVCLQGGQLLLKLPEQTDNPWAILYRHCFLRVSKTTEGASTASLVFENACSDGTAAIASSLRCDLPTRQSTVTCLPDPTHADTGRSQVPTTHNVVVTVEDTDFCVVGHTTSQQPSLERRPMASGTVPKLPETLRFPLVVSRFMRLYTGETKVDPERSQPCPPKAMFPGMCLVWPVCDPDDRIAGNQLLHDMGYDTVTAEWLTTLAATVPHPLFAFSFTESTNALSQRWSPRPPSHHSEGDDSEIRRPPSPPSPPPPRPGLGCHDAVTPLELLYTARLCFLESVSGNYQTTTASRPAERSDSDPPDDDDDPVPAPMAQRLDGFSDEMLQELLNNCFISEAQNASEPPASE